MAYERELTGLKGAAGLAGVTGRSLLNIAQLLQLTMMMKELSMKNLLQGKREGLRHL